MNVILLNTPSFLQSTSFVIMVLPKQLLCRDMDLRYVWYTQLVLFFSLYAFLKFRIKQWILSHLKSFLNGKSISCNVSDLTQNNTTQENVDVHPCLKWDSTRLYRCSSHCNRRNLMACITIQLFLILLHFQNFWHRLSGAMCPVAVSWYCCCCC